VVIPVASRLLVNAGYAQRHLKEDELREYMTALGTLGGALNNLPGDFVMDQVSGREQGTQAVVNEAVSRLRRVMSKLPDPSTYLSRLDEIQTATTVDRIGHEVDLQLRRQQAQH
jgi:hypothetical protein